MAVVVMPEFRMISASDCDARIRSWKLARLATDAWGLSYPSTNVLHPTHGIGYASGMPPAQGVTDAEQVQRIVDKMPGEMRACFEAHHLGIVRNESIRDWSDKARWLTLGLNRRTYYRRVSAGWRFVREWLSY